jgi:hypothetical protein
VTKAYQGHPESRQVRDEHDPRFKDVLEKDPEKLVAARRRIVAKGSAEHVAAHPEQGHYFCEHGSYVGGNGALADMFCPYHHD